MKGRKKGERTIGRTWRSWLQNVEGKSPELSARHLSLDATPPNFFSSLWTHNTILDMRIHDLVRTHSNKVSNIQTNQLTIVVTRITMKC